MIKNRKIAKENKTEFIPIEKLSFKVRKIADADGNNKIKNVKQVRIIPKKLNKEWDYTIEVVYEIEVPDVKEVSKNIASIDIGLNNLATITNNIGVSPKAIKGGSVKSINQQYNKELADLKSKAMLENNKRFTTKHIAKITKNRNNRIHDCLHKDSRTVVNYLIEHDIDTLVVGKNKNWKQNINLRNVNNQNFVQIPFAKFIDMLEYKCAMVGIKFILTEESYTSQASFIDGDKMPKKLTKKQQVFSGKRISCKLYESKDGIIINADVNGSYNIMTKVFPEALDVYKTSSLNGIAGAVFLVGKHHLLHPIQLKVA